MPEMRISPRERLVLTAIIELYIATGEPVASQAVAHAFAERDGLSSATIRNVMATLADAGLLEQPHTSAGRVPTPAAFRYYVEQITRVDPQLSRIGAAGLQGGQAAPLSEERRGQIEDEFAGVASSTEYLERTSHVLALISSGLGVALASSTANQVLEHIHFSRLSTGRVLAVLVTQAGAVLDRVLTLDRELTHLELETAARYLNENFHRWPIERIRVEVARRIEVESAAYHQMLASVEELCRKGALSAGEAAPALFVEGMSNLIAAEVDRERLRQMLLALEAKQRLVELLTAYVDGTPAGSAGGCGAGSCFPGDAGSGADWSAGAVGRRESGNGCADCADADSVSGDDSGGAVRCALVGADSGGSGGVGSQRPALRRRVSPR